MFYTIALIVLIAVVVWFVTTKVPMPKPFAMIILWFGVVCAILFILHQMGFHFRDIPVPQL